MAKKNIQGLAIPYGLKSPNKMANADGYYGTYDSLQDALDTVVLAIREPGRTVGVKQEGKIVEYWWESTTDLSDEALVPKGLNTIYYTQSKIILSDYMEIPIVINLIQNIDAVTDVFLCGIRLEDNTYVLTDSNILTILELPEIYIHSTSYKFIVKGVVGGNVLLVDSSTTFEIDENGYLIVVDDINNTSIEIDTNQNIVLEGDNPKLFPDMKIENSNLTIRE